MKTKKEILAMLKRNISTFQLFNFSTLAIAVVAAMTATTAMADVPQALTRYLGGETEGLWVQKENGKYLVDLRLANKRLLLQLGLREENIDLSKECTMCSHEKYWSHRYTKGLRGSQAACIVLEERP